MAMINISSTCCIFLPWTGTEEDDFRYPFEMQFSQVLKCPVSRVLSLNPVLKVLSSEIDPAEIRLIR
jgi:hypothetical protein